MKFLNKLLAWFPLNHIRKSLSFLVLSELKRSGTPLQRILKYLVSLPFLAFLSDTILELSEELDNFRKINRNSFKPPVSEEVKDMVRRNFTREIDFYMFCRQRLHRQLLALRLPSTWGGRGHTHARGQLLWYHLVLVNLWGTAQELCKTGSRTSSLIYSWVNQCFEEIQSLPK